MCCCQTVIEAYESSRPSSSVTVPWTWYVGSSMPTPFRVFAYTPKERSWRLGRSTSAPAARSVRIPTISQGQRGLQPRPRLSRRRAVTRLCGERLAEDAQPVLAHDRFEPLAVIAAVSQRRDEGR